MRRLRVVFMKLSKPLGVLSLMMGLVEDYVWTGRDVLVNMLVLFHCY
jgi:hypothetical protein